MNIETIAVELEEILESEINHIALPRVNGKTIKIKRYVVRKSSNGYAVFDSAANQRVAETDFKSSAIAIAKNLAEGKNITREILSLDYKLSKHYNDILVYRNIIKKSRDTVTKEIKRTQLEVSLDHAYSLKERLKKFIFS